MTTPQLIFVRLDISSARLPHYSDVLTKYIILSESTPHLRALRARLLGSYYALSTALYVYRLLDPKGNFPHFLGYQDVRDVAAAHVLALTSPDHRSRSLIAEKRPALKDRLTRVPAPVFSSDKNDIDFKRIEDVLGFRKEDYKGVEETVLEMVGDLIQVEKQWITKGVRIDIPLKLP